MTRVFLSYARGDDEPFVERLHGDLTKAGFTVWFDRASLMSRGLTFHQEIKDAIRAEVDRVVYVGGPRAALSGFVREEWQFALECNNVVVTPILRLGDYSQVPGELSLLHCEDFRQDANYDTALARLVASLRQPNPRLGGLFAVPSLPAQFLARPDLLCRVRDALLVDLQKPQAVSGPCVGMQGMGGIGKSVLAAALARNRQVRQSYPDGIAWIACGQHLTKDDLLLRLRDLARLLGADDGFASLAQGQGILRECLVTKAALLILDDVWRAADAQAFDVLGPRCRMLVTTRDAAILHTLRGELVTVSLFTEPEALQLLADAVGLEPDALPDSAREVVRECGLLPLALALSGGMARRGGGDFRSVLARLRGADLEKVADREAINEQHRSIWRAMQASVDVLPADQQRRFAELSVFATDAPVPEAAIATLWAHTGGLNCLDARELLISLSERSLVQLDQKAGTDGSFSRRCSLHDLLHDYAVRVAGDQVVIHQALLEAYRKTCRGAWETGPDDGYFIENLPSHLATCGCWDDLLAVVRSPAFGCLGRWVERGETDAGVACLGPLVDHLLESRKDLESGSSLACMLARIHSQRGDVHLAQQRLTAAIQALPWWRDLRTKAVACHELGSLHLQRGHYPEANACFRRALRICRLLGRRHRDEVSANLVALAIVQIEEHRYAASIRTARKGLRYALNSGDTAHVSAAHRTLASAFKDTLAYADAEYHLVAAMSFAEAGRLRVEHASAHMVLGWTRYTRSALDGHPLEPATTCFRAVMEEARRMHHRNLHDEAGIGLAWCALLAGNVDVAQRTLDAIPGHGGDDHQALRLLVDLGRARVEHEKLQLASAGQLYEAVAQFGREAANRGIRADALVGLGSTHWHTGSRDRGEASWRDATAVAQTCSPARQRLVEMSIEAARSQPSCSPR